MKTKLFYLFIAIFLFSFGGQSQNPVITLIGSGNGGWTDTAETPMITTDGITYVLVDKILTDGELKFREGKCWGTGCAATVTNKFGWGPTDAQFAVDQGWPSGTNATPVDAGKNITCKAGVWNITFNRILGTWKFEAGKPLPIIKLVGSAVPTPGGAVLSADLTGIQFSAKKVTLVPGTCQFSIDGVLAGGLTFPNGDAEDGTNAMTVTTTGIDYDISFDFTLYRYVFTVATFPKIAIIGSGAGGWPNAVGEIPGPIDINPMTTTDGITYTISNMPITAGAIKFRQDDSWNTNWGGAVWPAGATTGGDIPTTAGNYNGTFNKTTGAYSFTLNTPAVVGSGVGGWPNGVGEVPGPIDINPMTTVDGINYTLDGLVVTNGAAKFRINNDWGRNTGGDMFPAGTKTGNDIPTQAGTYNLKYNILTGAYDFGVSLSTSKFTNKSFKAYPNPTKASWNISSNDEITSVKVYDVLGKSVYAKNSAAKEVSVNATELSKGVYFAKVSTANGTSTVKLVKE